MKTTNYFNTLIEIAEDCPSECSTVPPLRGSKKSVANLQYEMLINNPYRFTSDDVIFTVHATRKGFSDEEMDQQRHLFFSKGQPCFRASPLTKRYGWGVHSDHQGRIAIYAVESDEYQQLVNDQAVEKTKAMRSKRAK